jgi:hypothetical protein
MQNPTANSESGRVIRVDLQHHVQELMRKALSRISSGPVQVLMDESTIQIHGSVGTWHEKQYAQESIRRLTNGRSIDNSLVVDGNR